jgi:predicted RNA-binding protein with EMAP domain
MVTQSIDEERLKDLLKSAIVEVLEEQRDFVRDLLQEALEDIAFAHAIEEGEHSGLASREEIFDASESGSR